MAKPKVHIGCSTVLSGDPDEAIHGRHIAQAIQLAVEQANARGDLPFEVGLVVEDDAADPDRAVDVARRFAQSNVLGVIGTMNSDTSLAAGQIYADAGLVQISPSASNAKLTQQGWPTFFRVVANDLHQGAIGAAYAVSVLHAHTIAIIHDGSSFGKPLARVFGEAARLLGAEVILFVGIQRGETDFTDLAQRMARAEPDLVFFGVIEAEGKLLAPQMREAGVTAIYFGTDGLKPSRFLATPNWPVEGPYHTNAGTDVYKSISAAHFVRDYQARYGETYSIYTAEAYDAANILIAALARAKALGRRNVRDEVARTQEFFGASGLISFDEHGELDDPRIGVYRIAAEQSLFLGYAADLVRVNGHTPAWSIPPDLLNIA